MRAYRQTIIISLIASVISLLSSMLITINSIFFLTNWYNCLISISGGVFASSIVVLLSALTNLRARKLNVANSYTVTLMQIDLIIRYLTIFAKKHQTSPNVATFNEHDFQKLEECYSSLADKFITLMYIERMSWISQKAFNHLKSVISKHSLAFLESSFKEVCANAATCCTIIAHLLQTISLHTEREEVAEAQTVISEQLDFFSEFIRTGGQYLSCRNAFKEFLDKLLKIPKSDES